MRDRFPILALATAGLLLVSPCDGKASEYAFSTYGLGGSAFGAGVTAPPGIYVTAVTGFYAGDIGATANFGGVVINAGAHVEGFTSGLNLLYIAERKVLGGNLGLSITIPVGHLDVSASVSVPPLPAVSRETDGWGLGDMLARAQLGWKRGDFSHIVYVQAVAPTGRWQAGFSPIIGLHRPGVDIGWAFTWEHKPTKLQFNGTAGFTFNFENTETNYRTGDEFHFEWAIGREIAPGLVLGVVGYDYRQITGDSGAGATLGSFKGSVDAIGAGLSYTTIVDKTPLILNLRHYQEFNAENRWEGNSTVGSATIRW